MGLFKTIKERWKSETPPFFKSVRKFALTIGGSSMAIWMVNESLGLDLHEHILNVCKYSIASCAAMGLTAQLAQANPPLLQPNSGLEQTSEEETSEQQNG